MAFSVHTFETNPTGHVGFAFHQSFGEGQELYFLAKFHPDTTEAQNMAESIFGATVDFLQASQITDQYLAFEEALKAANQAFNKVAHQTSRRPQIVMAFFNFNELYLSQSGQAEAYLLREGGLSQISENGGDTEDLFLNILSGQVSLQDVIILSSERILRTLTSSDLTKIFTGSDYGAACENFKQELSQKSETDLLVTLIGIGKTENGLPGAGFLSKVVKSGQKLAAQAAPPKSTPPVTPSPEPIQEVPEPVTKTTSSALPLNLSKIDLSALKNFRPQKNLVILAGVVLTLFVVVLGMRSINWESEEEIRLREELAIAREALQQADTFLLQGEKASVKEYLEKANGAVQEVFKSKSKSYRSDAQFLLADIQRKQLQVENARQVTPNRLADLSVKSDNIDAQGLLELDGSLFVYDSQQLIKTVRNIVESPTQLTEGGSSVLTAASRPDQKTLNFLTDNPRIIEYKEGILSPMQTQDENWKPGIGIQTYGRFSYLLSPTDNQIWKYERRRASYSTGSAYSQGADLAQAVSFTIDGSIYVLSANGMIQKLFRGQPQDYDFRDMPSIPFSGPNLKIKTTTELDYLYLLDPDNQRLLVFTKGERFATYKRQIIYDIDDVRDFVVDKNGQSVSLVTKNEIYEFGL